MADPDPFPPQPTPFPIRIVSDPSPLEPIGPNPDGPDLPPPSKPRSDQFYTAWDKFLAVEPRRAKSISRAARKLEQEKKTVEQRQPDGLQTKENAATSWEQAATECRAKVAAIVEECERLNQKYRDAIFDLEANIYCLQGLTGRMPKAVEDIDEPPWIKRVEDIFDNPQFYIDGATATDVHQGNGGDCWFLASLMAVSAKKELIENLCVARDEKVGVYGFVFYRDGEWIYEVIDDKLFLRVGDDDDLRIVRDWSKDKREGLSIKHDGDKLKEQLQRGGEALYFSHCKSSETWLPLIEKAYAKAHGDYSAIEGGFASEGIEDLTGGVAVVINPEDIMDKDRFWREQLSQVNEKYLFGGGSKGISSKGFVGGHAYTVLKAWEEGDLKLLKLRNPWGEVEWEGDWSDGSKLWTADMMRKLDHTFGDDGIFWISYKDFLKHFPSINRVRLFDKEWQVSQRWTCVDVPWTVDYLDTKFELTVQKQGPIVIVLSQPDDRYFYGLRGRYLFSLHFRLYRARKDGSRYLVRSMHNSGNETVFTRSVSAEMPDLEPGKYYVIFKVTAFRTQQATAQESILKYAIDRKDKLLQVGRRFDYAQTKGNLRAMEKASRRAKRDTADERMVRMLKRNRKYNKLERERVRRCKKRVDDALREKRKAIDQKEKEKRKKRREKMQARREKDQHSSDSREVCNDTVAEDGSESKADGLTPVTEESVVGEGVKTEAGDGDSAGRKENEVKAADGDAVEGASKTEEKDDAAQVPTSQIASTDDKSEEPAGLTSEVEKLSLEEKASGDKASSETSSPEKASEEPTDKTSASAATPEKEAEASEVVIKEEESKSAATQEAESGNSGSKEAKTVEADTKEAKSKEAKTKKAKNRDVESKAACTFNSVIEDADLVRKRPARRDYSPSSSFRDRDRDRDGYARSPEREIRIHSEDSDEDSYYSPPEPTDEMEDDDLDWDSDLDKPVRSNASSRSSIHGKDLDVFTDDPWNATCVLGLRVYSKGDVKISVVRDGDSDDEDGDDEGDGGEKLEDKQNEDGEEKVEEGENEKAEEKDDGKEQSAKATEDEDIKEEMEVTKEEENVAKANDEKPNTEDIEAKPKEQEAE